MSRADARAAHTHPLSAGEAHPPSPAEPAKKDAFPHIEAILSGAEVKQTFGLVEAHEGATFFVRAGAEVLHARRAKGCLVEPQKGDTVLVARSEDHGSFVLSVLVGTDDKAESVLSVDGDLTLRSKSGKVAILANEGVSLTSGASVAVNAPELVARTMKATIFSESLSYVGRKIEAQVERIKHVGQALESAIDLVTSRVKHSYRTIEELEEVKAKELSVSAEATLNMHGKNTIVSAEKLAKLDGEQIHIG
jgi:hypothetical protein